MKAPQAQWRDPYRLILEKKAPMRVDAEVFVSKHIPVEPAALDQLADAASLPGVERVVATPDIHVGFGVPIGGVVAAGDFISPAAVGYDINCGMRLIATPWGTEEVDIETLAREVRRLVPLGEGKSNIRITKKGLKRTLAEGIPGLLRSFGEQVREFPDSKIRHELDLDEELQVCQQVERGGNLSGNPSAVTGKALHRGEPQLGTLGGGNHFIEFQRVEKVLDESIADAWGLRTGQLVLMIHSGSRGLGHEIGGHYMKMAARFDRKHGIAVPNSNLAILPLDSPEGRDYLGAMNAAANYAFANRHVLAILAKGAIRRLLGNRHMPTVYDVAHNLASREKHGKMNLMVHRKGATRAFPAGWMKDTPFAETGQPVLVPGSMGTASWLLRGIEQGSKSLFSTNHGAGRVMSRMEARGRRRGKGGRPARPAAISDQEFEKSMKGVLLICENRRTIKEEAPGAYKDIDAVIDVVIGAGLAAPIARMVPLAVLKG